MIRGAGGLARGGVVLSCTVLSCTVLSCTVLLAAGCGGETGSAATADRVAATATAPHAARATATAAARANATAATTRVARQLAAAKYLAIATPANRLLDHDFDGLEDNEDSNIAAAEADLRAAAATERLFDHHLLGITFPARTEVFARLLFTVNQARAQLTTTAAASASLSRLDGYVQRLDAANEPVEEAVQVIRSQLGLPAADTS
jgi:hypothetical protein